MAKVKARAKAKAKATTKPKARPAARARATPAPKKRVVAKPTAKPAPKRKPVAKPVVVGPYLRSLRTCIYQVYDLALAKEFYSQALGKDPYFDEPFYVGFEVDGHELGLDPDVSRRPPGGSGVIGYWRVEDINAAWQHLTTIGATSIELPHSVGVDLQVSILADPFGNYIGLIQGA